MARDSAQVFVEIAARVDAGLQLDNVPGRLGDTHVGPRGSRDQGRIYTRGTPDFEMARQAGLLDRLAAVPPATLGAVQHAETLLGAALPNILRRLYLEVANGGFGPGYGVLGLDEGFRDDLKRTATNILEHRNDWPGIPDDLLPLCHWGCAIYSFVRCPSGRVLAWDPNPVAPNDDVPFFEQEYTIDTWLSAWLDGSLHQPTLIVEEDGRYRGATIAETEAQVRSLETEDDS